MSWRKRFKRKLIRYVAFGHLSLVDGPLTNASFQVLYEITQGKLGVLEPPPSTPAGREEVRQPEPLPEPEPEEEEEDLTEMQSRLQALRS